MNAQPQDSGEYQLRATNELGEITCKTVLNIKRKKLTTCGRSCDEFFR
jgi:hypothetical protein